MTSSIQHHLLLRSLRKEAMLMAKLRHPNGAPRRRRAAAPSLLAGCAVALPYSGNLLLTVPPPLLSPPVCLYLGACTDPPSLVFEYCAKSSLDMLLRAGLRHPQVRATGGGLPPSVRHARGAGCACEPSWACLAAAASLASSCSHHPFTSQTRALFTHPRTHSCRWPSG